VVPITRVEWDGRFCFGGVDVWGWCRDMVLGTGNARAAGRVGQMAGGQVSDNHHSTIPRFLDIEQ
jgi:hypothetical protein